MFNICGFNQSGELRFFSLFPSDFPSFVLFWCSIINLLLIKFSNPIKCIEKLEKLDSQMVAHLLGVAEVRNFSSRPSHYIATASPSYTPCRAARNILLYHNWMVELATGKTKVLLYCIDFWMIHFNWKWI